jgi:colicin import membrane protein
MEALRALFDDSDVYVTSQTGNVIDNLIGKRVANGWIRTPSARRGMAVVLQIKMLPDGTVTSVTVVKSSGDVPFDNSAVDAVKSISPLPEMNELKENEFQYYRSFKMTLHA